MGFFLLPTEKSIPAENLQVVYHISQRLLVTSHSFFTAATRSTGVIPILSSYLPSVLDIREFLKAQQKI